MLPTLKCLNSYQKLKKFEVLHISIKRYLADSVTITKTPVMADMFCPKGVELTQVLEVLESFAPKKLAENWDNTGLLIEPFTPRKISKILLTNDLTENVVEEAKSLDAQMIISYHPPIFSPLKCLTKLSWKERIVTALVEARIALYSPHTSWDSVNGGVNDWLASTFPIQESVPIKEGVESGTGCGRLCKFKENLQLKEVINRVKRQTGLSHLRVALGVGADLQSPISTVALCAGSGSSVLKGAVADIYLTGEMLHHDILDAAQNGISVILTNHSDSERGFLKIFAPKLKTLLQDKVEINVSENDRDPLIYI